MFYYAYIDQNNICQGVYALPTSISSDNYISITEEQYTTQSVVGMRWNADTNQWEVATTYYYAVLDPNDICEKILQTTTNRDLTDVLDLISLNENDETVIGKVYNRTTNQFEAIEDGSFLTASEADLLYSAINHNHDEDYAGINHAHDSVYAGINHSHDVATSTAAGFMSAADKNKLDGISESGGEGMTPTEILTAIKTVDGAGSGLDADKLDGNEASYFATADHNHDSAYAALTHNHNSSYAEINHTHTGFASSTHNHDADYAAIDHTHTGFASATHNHDADYAAIDHTHSDLETAIAGKADSTHTHSEYASATHNHDATYAGIDHTHSNYASATHTHTASDVGAASTSHTHNAATTSAAGFMSASDKSTISNLSSNYAAKSHTHTASEVGAASSSHTHSLSSLGAASSSHTHSDYASTSHTHSTISNDLNVTGVLKQAGNQVAYTSSSNLTLGTNNLNTIVAANESVTLNGSKVYTGNIYCRNTGGFDIGAYSNRFNNIYLTNSPSVSSDERLKEDICFVDKERLADFIDNIEVVNYKYLNDPLDRIGVIAQQLIEADKDLANYFIEIDGGKEHYLSLKPADLVFPLIVAVQELKKEIAELKQK